MSKDGFDNEYDISGYLNGKKVNQLNPNMKKFIHFMYGDIDENSVIKCGNIGGVNKADLFIEINKIKKNISIKKGSGNSVHQEPVEEFIVFLKETYPEEADEKIFNSIRFFIWGDLTFNGRGRKQDRMSATEFKKKFPSHITTINTYFSNKKEDLIRRFVVNGAKSHVSADYVYHGTVTSGMWEESNSLVNKILSDTGGSSAVPIGALTFQAWNRGVGADTKESTEKKRGVIQLKFGGITKYLIS